ncbi:MAG: helix-turn-helix transcriptional regulator [Parvularculales bacterium]
MTTRIDYRLASSEAIEDELSERVEDYRLRLNITQSRLAQEAGVSRNTISRLAKGGKGVSLDSFIRILKALRLAHNLELLIPAPQISPLEELKRASQPSRQRARGRKQDQKKWTWEDNEQKGEDAS